MKCSRVIRSLPRTVVGVAVLAVLAVAAADAAATTPREAWEASVHEGYRNHIRNGGPMAYVEEDPRLPRVLIIGDSISIGYTTTVRKALAGKANVLRIPDNANNTAHGLEHLANWLGEGRWDVIHFNWGLHDCFRKVPLEQYTANLEALVARLEKTGARLVWASSTPIPDGNPWTKHAGGEVAYNAAALAVMEKHGIPVNDLHALVAPRFAEFVTAPTDVHFNEPGSALLGQAVAVAIGAAVAAAPAAGPIRTGVIGLDAHGQAWLEIVRRARDAAAGGEATGIAALDIVAVYPAGSPDIPEKQKPLADAIAAYRAAGVEIVDSIEALLPKVDAVMILSVDGRAHLPQARPVIAAGKPLYVDKPVAASLADAREIFRLAAERGVPVFSSSSLRFAPGTQAVVRDRAAGAVVGCDAFSPCSTEPHHPDLFWYGIHGVETLFTLMGPGCERVTRTKTPGADVVVGTWKDGRIGTFRGLRAGQRGYGATAFCERAQVATGRFEGYEPLLVEIERFFRTGKPPVAPAETLEIVAFMEAAERSAEQGGHAVPLESPGR